MTNKTKKCLVFETLGKVSDMDIIKESADGLTRLHGVFGVCGIKNNNNRVYDKKNYGLMVEALQKEITEGSVLGELEHPNTMNITLENVSHKIESIEMNEDGTITGTIVLLDTPKGRIAKAIAEAAGSLYISSRGAGSIDGSGNVTLTTIKTYDLVGTPGFSQAKLNLAKGQKFESLCESTEDGNYMYAIIESDESDKADDIEDGKLDDKGGDDKKGDSADGKNNNDDKKENNKNNDKDATMNDLKEAIDKLSKKIESLAADLHIAQEGLKEKDKEISKLNEKLNEISPVNYNAIEQWVKDEFAPEFKESLISEVDESIENNNVSLIESISNGVQNWTINEFAPMIENYITEEFAPEIEGWITEEFAPEIEGWITEEFAPENEKTIKKWVNEEFANNVEGWITEELLPNIDSWITEECLPEYKESLINEVNVNINDYLESKTEESLSSIDNLLEAIEKKGTDDAALTLLKESKNNDKYKGVYVVENMPAHYRPSWELLSEAKQNEIIRQSRMYDFTKPGIMEKFWDSVDLTENKQIVENKVAPENNYHNMIASQMRRIANA